MESQELAPGRVHPRRATRVFTVLDGMILVAASSVGIAFGLLCQRDLLQSLPTFLASPLSTAIRTKVAGWAMPTMASATLGWLVARCRRPRPRLRVLTRQPGSVACGVAALMMIVQAASLPLGLKTMGSLTSPLLIVVWYWPEAISAGVLASWVILLSSRRWRTGTDWVDRSGVLIGACWVAMPAMLSIIEFW